MIKKKIFQTLQYDDTLKPEGDYVICRFSHCAKPYELSVVMKEYNELIKKFPRSKFRHSLLCSECDSAIVNESGIVTRTTNPIPIPTARTVPSKRGTYYRFSERESPLL